jgi:hypothetical protein
MRIVQSDVDHGELGIFSTSGQTNLGREAENVGMDVIPVYCKVSLFIDGTNK